MFKSIVAISYDASDSSSNSFSQSLPKNLSSSTPYLSLPPTSGIHSGGRGSRQHVHGSPGSYGPNPHKPLRKSQSVKKIIRPDPSFINFDPEDEDDNDSTNNDDVFIFNNNNKSSNSLVSSSENKISVGSTPVSKSSPVAIRRKRVQWSFAAATEQEQQQQQVSSSSSQKSPVVFRRRHTMSQFSSINGDPAATTANDTPSTSFSPSSRYNDSNPNNPFPSSHHTPLKPIRKTSASTWMQSVSCSSDIYPTSSTPLRPHTQLPSFNPASTPVSLTTATTAAAPAAVAASMSYCNNNTPSLQKTPSRQNDQTCRIFINAPNPNKASFDHKQYMHRQQQQQQQQQQYHNRQQQQQQQQRHYHSHGPYRVDQQHGQGLSPLMVSGLTRAARRMSTPAYSNTYLPSNTPPARTDSQYAKPLAAAAATASASSRRFSSAAMAAAKRRQLPKVPQSSLTKTYRFVSIHTHITSSISNRGSPQNGGYLQTSESFFFLPFDALI